jgi:hypothetical protein
MAILTDAQRKEAWADFMRRMSRDGTAINVPKADLRAAADAIDAWFDASVAALNAAIPQPARSALSASDKIELAIDVLRARGRVLKEG